MLCLPVAALLAFVLWQFIVSSRRPAPAPQTPVTPAQMLPPVAKSEPPKHRGDIVLIMDDVGFDRQPIERAMSIDPNINFAVLASGHNASLFASALHRRGFEILCHLPMEPLDPAAQPGPNAVTTSMSVGEIERVTRANLQAVPYARGVNNHMGSRATADRRVMQDVLAALPVGMYFVDSLTSGNSVAADVARKMKIRTVSRDVFLDDVQSESAIRRQIARLAATAHTRGTAVGIGHMYPVTVRVLAEEIPALRRNGFRFVRASEVVQ
jgi:polysaccharide deacetylase 2 family uncharacterized protein YibQ